MSQRILTLVLLTVLQNFVSIPKALYLKIDEIVTMRVMTNKLAVS